MNKYKQLTKLAAKTGISAAILVAICGAFYVGVSMYAENVAKQKSEVEKTVNADSDTLRNLQDQMNKSGEAEKRYAALQEKRETQLYASSIDEFFRFLSQAKTRYLIENLVRTVKPPKETPSDKEELKHFKNYDVMVRPLKFQFNAVSDVHVFSFLEDIQASAPGMIRIDSLTLKRVSDMSEVSYTNLTSGSNPLLVDAKLEITWITVVPKEQKEGAEATAKPNANAPAP